MDRQTYRQTFLAEACTTRAIHIDHDYAGVRTDLFALSTCAVNVEV